MKKFIVLSLVLSFALSLAVFPVLANDENNEHGSSTSTTTPRVIPPVFDVACVQNAIDKRDTAIIAALDTYHTAIVATLTTRKNALKAAWALTDRKARRAAINAAWKQFRADSRTAMRTLSTAKNNAWKQFRTDRKVCGKVPADEANGQGADTNL